MTFQFYIDLTIMNAKCTGGGGLLFRIAILVLCFAIAGCATVRDRGKTLPGPNQDIVVLDHKFFKIFYNKKFRLAKYVQYTMTADQLKVPVGKRKNKFIVDPLLVEMKLTPVQPSEYKYSGYDQGHLAPSADFIWSQEANDITFVMSNMAPQKPNLNRDACRRLEEKVRKWGCGEERIIVLTGPILEDKLETLKSGLSIPKQFFKVIIDDTPPRKVLTFIYNQSDKGDLLTQRMVKFKDLKEKTGINFESTVPHKDRDIFNRTIALSDWTEYDCTKK